MSLPQDLMPPTPAPQQSVEDRLARLEEKIDSIGKGTNWLMLKVEKAEHMFAAMASNPMIRQMLPKGMTRG